MRCAILALTFLLSSSPLAPAATAPGGRCDWDQWRGLPVQDGGRYKPLDSLAWETLRMIANRGSLQDPQSGEKLEPVALYLTMLFQWQGWDAAADPHAGPSPAVSPYFAHHAPDKWDRAPLLRVDYLALRQALGLAPDQKHVSPLEISKATITDPQTGVASSFLHWTEQLRRNRQQGLTTFEKKALQLADKLWLYEDHRMGRRLRLLPLGGSEDDEWVSVQFLLQTTFDDALDPSGKMRQIQQSLRETRQALLAGTPARFNAASRDLIARVEALGPRLGSYPQRKVIDWEVSYNRWAPFRFAWAFTLLAFLAVLLSMGTGWKLFYRGALLAHLAGVVAMFVGFGMRMAISGRAPVTNMYESVIYVGLGVAVLGMIFELVYRKKYILAAATAVSTLTLVLADNCSILLDPSLRPLQPVLRNNFWLVIHVLTITLSYAAFALALGISNITLAYFLVRSQNRHAINALNRFTYRSLQVGVLLLAIGTILGGVWADYAWGRFWGWDPKEVWALIALLGYLALLHARYAGWVGQFGLPAWSIACFSLVVVAWYGVNFVLGAGLHSYGFGGGGQGYVGGILIFQFLYVGLAALRYRRNNTGPPAANRRAADSRRRPATPSLRPRAEKVA